MTPIELTKTEFIQRVGNFEESPKDWKYVGDKPCIVDFHAPWCGYCKRLEPILDEFAKEYDGKLYIYKVNVDNEEELEISSRYRSHFILNHNCHGLSYLIRHCILYPIRG